MGDGGCFTLDPSLGGEAPPSPTSVATAAVAGGGGSGGSGGGCVAGAGGRDTPFGDAPPAGATLVGLTAYTRGPRLVGIRGLYAPAAAPATTAVAPAAATAATAVERVSVAAVAAAQPTTRGRLHGHGGRPHRLALPSGDLSLRIWRDTAGVCGVRVRAVGRGAPRGNGGAGGSVGLRGGDATELLPEGGGVARLWGHLDADGRLADLRADASPGGEATWGANAVAAAPIGSDAGGTGGDLPGAVGVRLVLAAAGSGDDGDGTSGGSASPCPFCGWVAGGAYPPPDLPPSAHEAAAVGDRAVHVLRCMDARIAARAAAGVGAVPSLTAAGGGDGDEVGAADAAAAAAARLAATPFPPGDAAELRAALVDARAEIRRLRATLPPAAAAAADRRRCVVCRDADTAVVLLGCGHAVLCGGCAAAVVGGGGGARCVGAH